MNQSRPRLSHTDPLTSLRGIGPRGVERLQRLGIHTAADLLFHLPLRYEDRTRLVAISDLRPGDHVVVEAVVQQAQLKFGRRRSLLVEIADASGSMLLRFFHFTAAQRDSLRNGVRLRCFGEVRNGPGALEMVHPEYRQVRAGTEPVVEETLTPVYPTTEGLHQMSWRDLTGQALQRLRAEDGWLPDYLPSELLEQHGLPSLRDALLLIHRPPPEISLQELEHGGWPARQRLVYEELLAQQLSLRQLRQQQRCMAAVACVKETTLFSRFLGNLPFSLTAAQERGIEEIRQDMAQMHPMLRLVQGDVGSGKTVIAAVAALYAIESGLQVALMAPTELLAEQHHRNFMNWLQPLGIEVGYLSGRNRTGRRQQLDALNSGELPLVIGTHALFQQEVIFNALGLVIVDEQHRFGVHQRLALKQKGMDEGRVPHQLVMTATPIPRTLAMAVYADLDLTVIDELPPGRTPVTTVALPDSRRAEVIARVERACLEGRQAYWVCTLIEDSELLQCQAAEETGHELASLLPALAIGLVHGRMKSAEKKAVMTAFQRGEVQLLVATTVIEVGVDVPNASLMIIENPERLGLAQLHQLRGRVGRGSQESHCVLLYHAPLGENAKRRLEIMRETTDGFEIARKDLELRGPGEVLGTRQTGELALRIADLVRDQQWVADAQRGADLMLRAYPDSVQPLITRWVGPRLDYGRV